MGTKTFTDSRVRTDPYFPPTAKLYAVLTGTVLWALTCGLLIAVYLHGNPRADTRFAIGFAILAGFVPFSAARNHPHAWPTFYAAMALLLMYASMMAR